MLNSGVNRSALLVQDPVHCPQPLQECGQVVLVQLLNQGMHGLYTVEQSCMQLFASWSQPRQRTAAASLSCGFPHKSNRSFLVSFFLSWHCSFRRDLT